MPPRRYQFGRADEATHPDSMRATLAEFLSTIIFVFAGEGSILALKMYKDTSATPARLVMIALAHGLSLFAAVASSVNVSGGHRPGGFALASGVGELRGLILEIVLTYGLVYTVYATGIDPKRGSVGTIAPLAIGLIVSANILVGGPFDGAAMNPARAFGPALVGWRWNHHWIYWVGPLIGGGLAALMYEYMVIPAAEPAHPTHQPLAPEDY
ncbi:hypothetical protein GOBAR_AA21601 [Gossypium barbadense]|uniref:Uncharacterized protein n=1 Tax=Gossypium barbadense TaxID=3634 RepID=A0A2P5X6V7_GOSBA|nr:hypothetical protein GOBAR_AA21601 [Gossypium barbadense]